MLQVLVVAMVCGCLLTVPAAAQGNELTLGGALLPEFHGAIDLTFYDYGADGYKSGKPTFDVYEFYLMTMVPISENVFAYAEPRYEHVDGTIELRQGYIYWQAKENLGLKFGRFYMPLGTYADTYYASTRKLVSYTYVNRLVGVTPWEDNGIMLLGQFPWFDYRLAVVNGLDGDYINDSKPRRGRQSQDDNNSDKFLGGRVGFNPVAGLNLGLSSASGYYDDSESLNLNFLDGDFTYANDRLQIKGEYIKSTAQTTGETVVSSGYYVHAAYKMIKDAAWCRYLELAARYDALTPGRQMQDRFTVAGGQDLSRVSLGVNIAPVDHFLLKFEYQTTTETPKLENDGVLFQACVDF